MSFWSDRKDWQKCHVHQSALVGGDHKIDDTVLSLMETHGQFRQIVIDDGA